MSQENVEFVKTLLPEFLEQVCDPEIEWIEDPQRPDGRIYRGHEGVRESWEQWFDQWEEYGFEVERIVDCGEAVLVVNREQGRGKASGATVSARNFMLLTFRDGKILRYQEFYDEADAREAAGLSEPEALADA